MSLTAFRDSDGAFRFRVSPLVLGQQVIASAVLLDTRTDRFVVAERTGSSWRIQPPDGFNPDFFVAEYRAPAWDVAIAASLLSTPVPADQLRLAWGVLFREVARADPDRAREISEAVAATPGNEP